MNYIWDDGSGGGGGQTDRVRVSGGRVQGGGGADRPVRVRVSPPERIRSTTCLWVGGGGGQTDL